MTASHDTHSLSTFKRDSEDSAPVKEDQQPIVLTIKGKPSLVVQDAESYWKLVEAVDRRETVAGIRRGLVSMKRNAGELAEKFFEEFFIEKRLSERE